MSLEQSNRTRPPGVTTATPERPAQQMAAEVLTFDLRSELALLRAEEAWRVADHNAKTLLKEPDLRIVLVALKAGGRLQQHQAAAQLSIQTISGRVRIHLPDRTVDVPSGRLMTLERDIKHQVEALEESDILLTLAWPK